MTERSQQGALAADEKTKPPSYFASLGQPCCSRWGKTEIEFIALAYVQALANGGDTWRKLSKRETHELLTPDQQHRAHPFLTSDFGVYEHWFNLVRDQIKSSAGAFGVGGFWR